MTIDSYADPWQATSGFSSGPLTIEQVPVKFLLKYHFIGDSCATMNWTDKENQHEYNIYVLDSRKIDILDSNKLDIILRKI